MKSLYLILLFLLPFFCSAQSVYTSRITQTWPTIFNTEYHQIERTISIEENAISIGTQTTRGKEFQLYYIQKIDLENNALTYYCLTGGNERVTIKVPSEGKGGFIDLFRKSRKSGEEVQERYHVF